MKENNMFWQPVFGCVEVSSLCNYKCKMCNWWKSEKEEWPFSADEFVKILDDVKKYIPKKLDFTLLGGEPTFWKDLDKFIENIDKTKFNPILNTNSSMLSEKKVRKLHKAGLKVFILSLDSINPDVHDYYRGRKGSFKEVMRAIDIIDEIYKGKQVITILPIIMEKNYRDLHKMVKWVGSNSKLHNISMQAVMPNIKKTQNILEDQDYKDIWPKNSNNLTRELKRVMLLKRLGYSEVINNPDSQLRAFIDYYRNPYAKFNENTLTFCTYFSIKANGDLIISGQTVGSLKDKKFNELWESEKGIKARQNVYEKKIDTYWYINTLQAYKKDPISNLSFMDIKQTKNLKFIKNNQTLENYNVFNSGSRKLRLVSVMKNVIKPDSNLKKPNLVIIKLINTCSFKCKMCNVWEDKNTTDLDLNTAYGIIDQVSRFNDDEFFVHFIGGETLLYKKLPELIKYTSDKGINTTITTNGYNLNKEKITVLSGSGLSHLSISLDSINEKTHDLLRGKEGSYNKIMKGLLLLEKYAPNLNVSINTGISDLNLFDLVALSKFVLNDNLKHIYFIAMDKPFQSNYDSDWRHSSPVSFLWPKDHDKIDRAFDLLIWEKRNNKKIKNSIEQLELYREYYKHPEKFVKKKGCKFGDKNIQIDQTGNIMLCSKNFLPIGHINKDVLSRVFFSGTANKLREKMLDCNDNCVQILSCSYESENC